MEENATIVPSLPAHLGGKRPPPNYSVFLQGGVGGLPSPVGAHISREPLGCWAPLTPESSSSMLSSSSVSPSRALIEYIEVRTN